MYKWNDSYLEKMYNRVKEWALRDYKESYKFTEEELSKPYLSSKLFPTKSPRIWRMLTLAFLLGQMNGIRIADEGKTPITFRSLKDSKVEDVGENKDQSNNQSK